AGLARHRGPAARGLRRRTHARGAVHAGRHRAGGAAGAGAAAAGAAAGVASMSAVLAADQPAPAASLLLRAEGLSKNFGGVRAVRGISLSVPAGAGLRLLRPDAA